MQRRAMQSICVICRPARHVPGEVVRLMSNRPNVNESRGREMKPQSTVQRVGAFQIGSGGPQRRLLFVPIECAMCETSGS